MRKWLSAGLVVLTVLYPLVVYAGMGHVAPHWLAVLLMLLGMARAIVTRQRFWWVVAAGAGVLALAAWQQGDPLLVKLYPALVNVVLLVVFAYSLFRGPSVVERLARLREPDLPMAAVRYTAQVTGVWCIFFIANGVAAGYTAFYSSDAVWALYNGLLAYVLMGCLMAAEWCMRQRMRRKHAAH
jgi:uncharacterized membrane protein